MLGINSAPAVLGGVYAFGDDPVIGREDEREVEGPGSTLTVTDAVLRPERPDVDEARNACGTWRTSVRRRGGAEGDECASARARSRARIGAM